MQLVAACLGNCPGVLQSGFHFIIDCWCFILGLETQNLFVREDPRSPREGLKYVKLARN